MLWLFQKAKIILYQLYFHTGYLASFHHLLSSCMKFVYNFLKRNWLIFYWRTVCVLCRKVPPTIIVPKFPFLTIKRGWILITTIVNVSCIISSIWIAIRMWFSNTPIDYKYWPSLAIIVQNILIVIRYACYRNL